MKIVEGTTRRQGRETKKAAAVRGAPDPRFAARQNESRFSHLHRPQKPDAVADSRLVARARDRIFQPAPVDSRGRSKLERELDEQQSHASDDDDEEVEAGEEEEDVAVSEEGSDEIAHFEGSDCEEIDATNRIAVVNCDWDHIRAVDLFAVFFHCLPLGGRLLSVKVYLSDFGREQLETERIRGPDLWTKVSQPEEIEKVHAENALTIAAIKTEAEFVDVGDEADQEIDDGFEYDNPAMFADVGPDGDVFVGGKYRQYELNRMKYYYAVAEFDSAQTASVVYQECDGMDVEASGVVLDLRYVPDEETFDASRVHNSATRLPRNYKPLKAFRAAALSQTRFKISWDQDDPHRVESMRAAFTDDSEEANLAAYMASDSSSDEDEAESANQSKKERRKAKRAAIRAKYAALLADIGGLSSELPPDNDDDVADANDETNGVELEDLPTGRKELSLGDSTDDEDHDDLNRFSDASFSVGDVNDDEIVEGNVEGTFTIDAGDKAQRLATELKRKKLIEGADLGTAERTKYKLKRKEAKSAKREAMTARRETQDAEEEAAAEGKRAMLASRLAEAIEAPKETKRGRNARKEMAAAIKAKAKIEARELKKRRAVARLGGEKAVTVSDDAKAREASKQLDSSFGRFADRLLRDPRFHVDPTSERARQDKTVKEFATTVSVARRAKVRVNDNAMNRANDGRADLDFFLTQSGAAGKKKNPRK